MNDGTGVKASKVATLTAELEVVKAENKRLKDTIHRLTRDHRREGCPICEEIFRQARGGGG